MKVRIIASDKEEEDADEPDRGEQLPGQWNLFEDTNSLHSFKKGISVPLDFVTGRRWINSRLHRRSLPSAAMHQRQPPWSFYNLPEGVVSIVLMIEVSMIHLSPKSGKKKGGRSLIRQSLWHANWHSWLSLPMLGNDAVQLYTEWTNRQLTKVNHRQVSDLSTELRDYRVVAAVVQAVVSDPQRVNSIRQNLTTVTSNIDGLNVCLRHLQQVGVNCNRITATDIDAGQLGSVLQLLYSLHNYKQNNRERKPPATPPSPAMPPSAPTTRLPSTVQQRSSRLQPPTSRLATPTKSAIPTGVSPSRPAPPSPSPKTAIRPPSSIRPPSGNNNGSVTGSSTYTTLIPPGAKTAVRKSQLQPPKNVSTNNSAQPKMLKMKFFTKDQQKEPPVKKAENKKTESALRQPTRTSRLAPPTKTAPVQLRVQPPPSIVKPSPEKRTSKSSEEDSAYAGFGSTSPASSTQSSISLRSASSKGSREHMCEPETQPENHKMEKPTLAVRALGMTPPAPLPSPKKESPVAPAPSPSKCEKATETATVGVVSPIVQRKVVDCQPSSSNPEEKIKPAVPVRKDSRVETPKTTEDFIPPSIAPSLPTYAQLLREGRFQGGRTEGRFDSSTSEDSLDSVTTTIRLKPTSGCCSEGNTLNRPVGVRARSSEPSGYTSEGGIAIYQKMQERMRECRENMRRFDYGDSFEDSSSLSSGISDNFDDISTDDLSGPDHPMAKVAYASSSCDYQTFARNAAKGPRGSSIDSRARRIAEQENLHALLQQCRTSQRGAGTLHTPFSPQLGLSAEAEALRSRSRSSNEPTASLSGFHSLDRKSQFAEFYGPGWQDRAALALVSPRRVPQQQRGAVSASLNAGGMSRSLVMLESSSPRPKRKDSPRSRGRLQLSVASPVKAGSTSARDGYGTYGEMQLHRLADEVRTKDSMGSQLSLASSTAYNNLNDKYEAEIRKMSRELDGYRMTVHKLSRKHDDYAQLMDMFNQKLSKLSRHVEKAQLKPDEVGKLRIEIENLRAMSSRVAQNGESRRTAEGAGELLRQPSLESVVSMASQRSSMSSSSKSSKADKASLNSFGIKSKKSWASNVDVQIRSSFTKAFSKKKSKGGLSDTEGSPMHLHTIGGSNNRLDEVEVDELKKQLEDRDVALTDVRLDALDRAREVDLLRETVNRLKTENKQLKQDMSRLLATRSRTSSQASLAMHDEEPLYEVPPTTSSSTPSSKRSSGCNSVKVTVNVDLRGVISSEICPEHEIIIGFLPMPTATTSWGEMDQQIAVLFDNYIGRVDGDRHLGLHSTESVIGYQMGSTVRRKMADEPSCLPSEVISPTTTVRLFLRGASQKCVDSLVLETLFPSSMLEQLLKFLLNHRRLVLSGATGIGKSNIARQLAAYLAFTIGQTQDIVHDIKIPENDDIGIVLVEEQLEKLLKASKNSVILLDNVPRNRIAFISSVFSSAQLVNKEGPFVICTVNRACNLPEMQINHNFKMFLLTNRMDGVRGFMGRFLRRRIIEAEHRLGRQSPSELLNVIAFLPEVLQAVNDFIEKANSLDVTVGPRIFLQCPLGVDESRDWFVKTWNTNIIPYMVRVAREGVKVLGRCGNFEDPTEAVCDKWPWTEGPSGEDLLHRLSIKDIGQTTKQAINPLDALIRLQANRAAAGDGHV